MILFYVLWVIIGITVAVDFCEDMWNQYKDLLLISRVLVCSLPFTICVICWPVWVIHEIIELIKKSRT